MASERHQIPQLTTARFFAAFLVVIFHYPYKAELFPASLADFGYEPVTFFFILSGFILTYTHATKDGLNLSVERFAKARFWRLFPTYFLALLISAPFFLAPLIKARSFDPGIILVPTMLQSWWPPSSLAWNAPAWSLSNEAFFYAIFPAAWLAMRRAPSIATLSIAISAIAMVSIARFIMPVEWHNFSAYHPIMNLPQFILGMAVCQAYLEGKRISPTALTVLAGALVFSIVFKINLPFLSDTLWLSVIFAGMILGLASNRRPMLAAPWLVKLGDASYAIYILHVPIWKWWNHIFHVQSELSMPRYLEFSAYAAIVLVVSIAAMMLVKVIPRTGRAPWGSRARRGADA